MEARPCAIFEFLDGTKQMLIPLFQRPYEWNTREWNALWDDLLEQYENYNETVSASHFTGAIVTAPARSVPVGVSKFLVIDGQQRLTTFAVIVCTIRSLIPRSTPQYRKLTKLLVNEDDGGLDYYKLLPTQPDRPAFQALVKEEEHEDSRFSQAFEFFCKKLKGADSNGDAIDLDRMADALKTRLTVVAIHLGESDDPYLIFESLNAKGAPLTQADLIRNYILLRLHAHEQQHAYESAWLPMQSLLPGDHLAEFMRHYLMQSGEEVAKSAIYFKLKERMKQLSDPDVFGELNRLREASRVYARIVGVSEHSDPEVARRLARLRRWEIAVANPFILKLLLSIEQNDFSLGNAATCLEIIESFAVRRAVCNVPTNQLKRVFLSAAKDMPKSGDIAGWLRAMLSDGASGRRWPKDEEFRDFLFRYRAYSNPLTRCKFVLESLEDSYAHKEPASYESATIEHVMPKTLTPEWKEALGPAAEAIQEKWLDLFGNLTLTGYNGELSNSPFIEKRQLLANSHFMLNKWIFERGQWGVKEMEQRTSILFDKARKIWSRPQLDLGERIRFGVAAFRSTPLEYILRPPSPSSTLSRWHKSPPLAEPSELCYSTPMKRDEVLTRLRAHEAEFKRLGVESLYLFGSTAREEAREDSDVDLFFDHERGA